ncbi:enoyl-CoA hydratase/isomerase family protein [Amycolatopsis sp. K13G38]|uniref:Enoyl-CoA hydratase/isomerase family protein n=1 Tax=Amycolatopsis acididurans TaxID=2724524 RepID=A0ABX1JHA2_9PSEU|nr:enoyl-CoA hydratase/isomerase family protein [Amycolatopsis acididurans]NKQ58209.1 enoyl-CoA hydratase/isomerase family protein [Amycolatopsis acididurans]
MSGPIVLSRHGHVAVIRMHVPSKLNALNPAAVESLLDAVRTACRADDVHAIVLTGGESAFCSGEDLTAAGGLTAEEFSEQVDNFQRLTRVLLETDKPTVAAVAGVAIGGGLELALNCDMRMSSSNARFRCPESQLGMTVSNASSLLLRRCVGEGWARELIVFGRVLDAQTALSVGLVTRVVATGTVVAEAIQVASSIAAAPRHSVAYAKQLLRAATPGSEKALELESNLLRAAFRAQETTDLIASFNKGRKQP